MKVLISGASIAGPTLAHWLNRSGFTVTVVEKASALRAGGYPIDIRGTAVEVVRRMGLLSQLREAHIDSQRATFIGADGDQVASLKMSADASGDLEVRRGDLAENLYALVRDDVEFLFNDSIDTLDERGPEVEVRFRSGRQRTFDLVIGADGVHSQTRKSLFGSEEQFSHYLGYGFGIFTLPNTYGMSHELTMWNDPGRSAALYAVGDDDELHGFLNFHRPEPPSAISRDLIAQAFDGAGWEVPHLIEAMYRADDLYFDTVSQIRVPQWSRGRVALVGDAAYAPSFLTGQGTSLALAGGFLLAHSLSKTADHEKAFAAYEQGYRGFVQANQSLIARSLYPVTAQALEERNATLRSLEVLPASMANPVHSSLALPV